ncbi:acyltransferase domain-containing protein [Streptomyces vinaceus]
MTRTGTSPTTRAPGRRPGERPRTAFVFSGQGSEWPGMASRLLDASLVFREHFLDCADAVARHAAWSPEDVLRGMPGSPHLGRVEVVQPVLFCVNTALAELWTAHGTRPDAVFGQSQGEVAAACLAGALSRDEAAGLLVARARLLAAELAGRGGIAAVALGAPEVRRRLRRHPGLTVAGDIGPRQATVAGPSAPLERFVAELRAEGVRARVVAGTVPSHGPAVEALRDRLIAQAAHLRPRPARLPLYSTVTGGRIEGTELTGRYWYENARRPVLLAPVVRRLVRAGVRGFVEPSPHPLLTVPVEEAARAAGAGPGTAVTGTLRRGHGDVTTFLRASAEFRAHRSGGS